MPKLVSIDDQRYAALTLQSLRVTTGPLQASTTSLESQESYLTAGMLPYNRNVTLQTFLSSTRDFYRLHSTFARLYNAAASPASRLRSAGSLAIKFLYNACSDWLKQHALSEIRERGREGVNNLIIIIYYLFGANIYVNIFKCALQVTIK